MACSELIPAAIAQNAFHGHLGRYINGCVGTRADKLVALVSSRLACRAGSGSLIERFRHYTSLVLPENGESIVRVSVEPYNGDNPHVLSMRSYLQERLSEDLLGAYVHGSLGSHEAVKYSDFDALVILKRDVFVSRRRLAHVAGRLNDARRIMLDFDLLQHHGWFVLVEDDLRFYCDAYFPRALFEYAKSLLPSGQELTLYPRDSRQEARVAFEKLVDAVISKLVPGKKPKNMYELKCLTSEIMLLPALYWQCKTGEGVYKKMSFERARHDFAPEIWEIMDKISALRIDWEYAISPIQCRFFGRPGVLRDFLISRAGPEIPEKIAQELTPEFFSAIHNLARHMRASLDRV